MPDNWGPGQSPCKMGVMQCALKACCQNLLNVGQVPSADQSVDKWPMLCDYYLDLCHYLYQRKDQNEPIEE